MIVEISKSDKPKKKYKAKVENKTIHFGHSDYEDYTTHKDPVRKQRYLDRHKTNENWGRSGVDTAGFYSRWILWNKTSIKASVSNLNNKYSDLNFVMK